MLRSIMAAALAEIPHVVIDEWIADSEFDTEDLFEKLLVSTPDVLVLRNRKPCDSTNFERYWNEFPRMKLLIIDEQGKSGCLYTLSVHQLFLNELTISVLVDVLSFGRTNP